MPVLAKAAPLLYAGTMLSTWFLVYVVATGLGHAPYWLPMISDCLVFSPEGNVARWGLCTSQNFLVLSMLLVFKNMRRCAAGLPPSATPWPLLGCLMSDHADLGLGLLACVCGVFPFVVSEFEESFMWRTCDFRLGRMSGSGGWDAEGNCNLSASCLPPAVLADGGSMCLEKSHGVKWHSDFAVYFFMLLGLCECADAAARRLFFWPPGSG